MEVPQAFASGTSLMSCDSGKRQNFHGAAAEIYIGMFPLIRTR
jgi:hypothetical protein